MRFFSVVLGCGIVVASFAGAVAQEGVMKAANTSQAASAPATSIARDAEGVNPGILCYTVNSGYQKGPNKLEILLPDGMEKGKRYPVVLLLPVNTGTKGNWGSGIVEVQKRDLHNRYGVICVAPAYDTEPWYGDNPGRPQVRQQAYLLDVAIAFVEKEFPTLGESRGRFVVGFSKSGLGALCLFLRNTEAFSRVAAFDPSIGPPSQETFKTWGFAESYGTRENFDNYDPMLLLEKKQKVLAGKDRRIVLMADGPGSRIGVDVLKTRMGDLKIPHTYVLGSDMGHSWNTGWLPLAFAGLGIPAAEDSK